jgi:uncharacterized membrane protein
MVDDNLILYVASYDDATSAQADFQVLKDAEGPVLKVEGAVVMSRDGDGQVDVLTKGSGMTGGGAVLGGGVGLVVGLFAPPLPAATAVGAGIGAALGHFTKKHEEKQLGVDLDEYFPANSSAVVVVLNNKYLQRVQQALEKANKNVSKAIDSGDYDQLQEALAKSEKSVGEAADS